MKQDYLRQRGQTLIESALLMGLVALLAIGILTVLGRKTRDVFATVHGSLVTTAVDTVQYAAATPPEEPPEEPPVDPDYGDSDDIYDFYRGRGPAPGHPDDGEGPDVGHDYAKGRAMDDYAQGLRDGGVTGDDFGRAMEEFGDYLDGRQ